VLGKHFLQAVEAIEVPLLVSASTTPSEINMRVSSGARVWWVSLYSTSELIPNGSPLVVTNSWPFT
jgi:hypothetical protein